MLKIVTLTIVRMVNADQLGFTRIGSSPISDSEVKKTRGGDARCVRGRDLTRFRKLHRSRE